MHVFMQKKEDAKGKDEEKKDGKQKEKDDKPEGKDKETKKEVWLLLHFTSIFV